MCNVCNGRSVIFTSAPLTDMLWCEALLRDCNAGCCCCCLNCASMSAGSTPGAAATSLPGASPAEAHCWRGHPLTCHSFTVIKAEQGSSIAPACESEGCASEALQQPAMGSLSRLSHMAGALTVHSNRVVQRTIDSAACHALLCVTCTLDVSLAAVTILSRHELCCDSMCCELQLKSYVVPAGHCNARLRPSIACQLSALGRQRLMGSVLVFACGGGGPERIIPCQLVPHLEVRCMTSAMSPCFCLAMASHNTSAMPCPQLLNTLATM